MPAATHAAWATRVAPSPPRRAGLRQATEQAPLRAAVPQVEVSALSGEAGDIAGQVVAPLEQDGEVGATRQHPPRDGERQHGGQAHNRDAPQCQAQARNALQPAQCFCRAARVLTERVHFLEQRAANLLAHHGIEPGGVRVQPLKRRGGERLLGLRGLHEKAGLHGVLCAARGHADYSGSRALSAEAAVRSGCTATPRAGNTSLTIFASLVPACCGRGHAAGCRRTRCHAGCEASFR